VKTLRILGFNRIVLRHIVKEIRNYLNKVFAERWIRRKNRIELPARSPDLSSFDYFLWSYLKNKIYTTKPQTIDDLCRRILDETAFILRD